MTTKNRTIRKKIASKKPRRRCVIRPDRKGDWPFSDGVWVGSTLYLSGHLGYDMATRQIPADVNDEIRLMLNAFQGTLRAAGLEMRNLVYVQIFCSDVSLFATFNAIYREYFGKEFPARAFLGSGPLLFGAKFEIQGIASRE
jgi:2-iminobutanoate/2-iminopropanoate deaminase